MTPRIAVVIPAYNEEGKVGRVLAKIPKGVIETAIVVDDASRDGTAEGARRGGAHVITQPQNMGVGAALRTGIDYARAQNFDIVAILSGDDQHDPSELPRVLQPLLDGECDLVQGSRRLGGGTTVDMNLFRRVTTYVYPWLFRLATGFRFASTDATNGFRAFRLAIFDDARINLWQPWLDTYELEPYLLHKAVTTGRRVREVTTRGSRRSRAPARSSGSRTTRPTAGPGSTSRTASRRRTCTTS